MPQKNFLIPALLILILSSCSSPADDPAISSTPTPVASETSTSDTPDVLVPVDAAVESVIEQDVAATKQQVEVYILTNPNVSSFPEDLIINSQSRIAVISIAINPDRTYTVVGSAQNSDFQYELTGQLL